MYTFQPWSHFCLTPKLVDGNWSPLQVDVKNGNNYQSYWAELYKISISEFMKFPPLNLYYVLNTFQHLWTPTFFPETPNFVQWHCKQEQVWQIYQYKISMCDILFSNHQDVHCQLQFSSFCLLCVSHLLHTLTLLAAGILTND